MKNGGGRKCGKGIISYAHGLVRSKVKISTLNNRRNFACLDWKAKIRYKSMG